MHCIDAMNRLHCSLFIQATKVHSNDDGIGHIVGTDLHYITPILSNVVSYSRLFLIPVQLKRIFLKVSTVLQFTHRAGRKFHKLAWSVCLLPVHMSVSRGPDLRES